MYHTGINRIRGPPATPPCTQCPQKLSAQVSSRSPPLIVVSAHQADNPERQLAHLGGITWEGALKSLHSSPIQR